jgi:glutathione S-transferase
MIKLYHLDRSPFNWKVRFVLAEKGIPYEGIVPLNKTEDPAFAKLNPYRLTPVLQVEDGRTLYESTVICEYLEDVHPEPALLPKEPFERARMRLLEDTTDQYLYAALRDLRAAQFEYQPPFLIRKPMGQVDHAALEAARTKVHTHLERLEAELEGKTWFGGTQFTLADITLAPALTGTLELLGVLPDPKRYPNLAAWRARIVERPAYDASKPKEPLRIQG